MIRRFVDFALNNRLLVLALAALLFAWGVISFKNLPIEAYPDVANNYVQVITQWPGRAAEEVEQQVTRLCAWRRAHASSNCGLRPRASWPLSSRITLRCAACPWIWPAIRRAWCGSGWRRCRRFQQWWWKRRNWNRGGRFARADSGSWRTRADPGGLPHK